MKCSSERRLISESGLSGNFGQTNGRILEQLSGALDSPLNKPMVG
jgi:hypothetical protein